jgi:hypothetical protein
MYIGSLVISNLFAQHSIDGERCKSMFPSKGICDCVIFLAAPEDDVAQWTYSYFREHSDITHSILG